MYSAKCAGILDYVLPILTHSSPSGRFRPGKIADFLGLLDHVCTLLKIYTTMYLVSLLPSLKNRTYLSHIQPILEAFKA